MLIYPPFEQKLENQIVKMFSQKDVVFREHLWKSSTLLVQNLYTNVACCVLIYGQALGDVTWTLNNQVTNLNKCTSPLIYSTAFGWYCAAIEKVMKWNNYTHIFASTCVDNTAVICIAMHGAYPWHHSQFWNMLNFETFRLCKTIIS